MYRARWRLGHFRRQAVVGGLVLPLLARPRVRLRPALIPKGRSPGTPFACCGKRRNEGRQDDVDARVRAVLAQPRLVRALALLAGVCASVGLSRF